MSNEVAVIEESLTAKDIHAQVQRIQQVMEAVMKKDTHYGVVPGCGDKPTLLKAGAEKLMMTFRLAADPVVEDLSENGIRRYRVLTKITSQATGIFLGTGVGECSSEEEKYAWRAAVSQEEYEAADPSNRRLKYKYKQEPIHQVRTNPADVANTVLKISKKRSLVDGVLTVTAASDIFTQDIEDMPEGIIQHDKPLTALKLPNYGHHKGQPMDDPSIPVNELLYYLDGVEKSLADPSKVKYKANNEKMRDALKAQIEQRTVGEQAQGGPQGDVGGERDAGTTVKSSQGGSVLPPTPQPITSQEQLLVSYRADYRKAPTVHDLSEVGNAMEADPDLSVENKKVLRADFRQRMVELGKKK